jgi:dTDP-4-dehydrorhamnose 3,5-epimerase
MKFQPLGIKGAWLIESEVFADERGTFQEWFKSDEVKKFTGIDFSVAQANISTSRKGVIRGIHFSLAPEGQSKWITCTSGRILDVIVDIRSESPTFKHVEYIELHGPRAIFIGAGLGHGFISLEDNSVVSYLLSSPYAPEFELAINPHDQELHISWPKFSWIISKKDNEAKSINDLMALDLLPRNALNR